jgi:hypothetical protein
MRWLEQRYFYNGQNPYDVALYAFSLRKHEPPPECARNNRFDPKIGPLYYRQGGYPPWYFLTATMLILPTDFNTTRIYFAVLNGLALAFTAVWAYRFGRFHSLAAGVMLGSATLALYGNYKAIEVGQFGILVNAFLIGAYWLAERQKPVAAGISYGMAILKPQISALFVFIFLVRRQWKLLLAATAYGLLACAVAWAVTRTNPVEMTLQMVALTREWTHPVVKEQPEPGPQPTQLTIGRSELLSLFEDLGASYNVAMPLAALVGLIALGVLLWRWRKATPLTLLAIAATVSRLWSYHYVYDDVMLVFLLVALGRLALTHRSLGTVLAFGLVGLSLWTPVYYHLVVVDGRPHLALQIAQMLTWLFGLAVLLAWEPRSNRGTEELPRSGPVTDALHVPAAVAGQGNGAVNLQGTAGSTR